MSAPDLTNRLVRVASVVEDATTTSHGWEGPNELIGVRFTGDGPGDVEIAFAPLDGDIGECLGGFRAPDTWDAVGVVAVGWVRPLEADGGVGARAGRMRTVHLQHRDGSAVAVLRVEGGAPRVLTGPAQGRIPDLLHQALGLPVGPAS